MILVVVSLILLSVFITNNQIQGFGHGAGSFITSRDLRIEDETFSASNTTTNGTITISGKLVSLSDFEIKSPITILLTSDHQYDPITKGIHDLTIGQLNYKSHHAAGKAYEHQTDWYFTVESNPNEISLKPGEVADYEMIIHPLKAGTYHIHTLLPSTTQYIGPGETIQVEGSNQITSGEFWGLYATSYLIILVLAWSIGLLTYFVIKRKSKFHKIKS